jgi:hypothetical protein
MVLVVFVPACGSQSKGTGKESPASSVELEQIAELYKTFVKEKNRLPTGVTDLKPYEERFPFGFQGLRSGLFLVNWSAGVAPNPSKPTAVLAYEKDTPTQGGVVVMNNGAVRRMTAQEFQTAASGNP